MRPVMSRTPGRELAALAVAMVAILASALPTSAAEEERSSGGLARGHAKGVVIVGFEPGASKVKRNLAEDAVSATDAGPISPLATNVVVMELPAGQTVAEAIETLEDQPGVKYAEPDYFVEPAEIPNDPSYTNGQLWGMYGESTTPANQYGTGAGEAWAAGAVGDDDVYVAVIDGGVQLDHPDLVGNVDVARSRDVQDEDSIVYEGEPADGHATHVAGIIGARGGNGVGVAGVNWDVTIISVKFIGASGLGTYSDAIEALDYVTALKNGGLNIVATNNSWGCLSTTCSENPALQAAIMRGADAGILFVAAAGNNSANIDSVPFYPASQTCPRNGGWDCIISVANIASGGALGSLTNYGASGVDLGAPGSGIRSTVPGGYNEMSGTSMAAPHVTGAIALCASLRPALGPDGLRSRVLASGTPTPSLATTTVTGKRLDVGALVQQCGSTVPNVVSKLEAVALDDLEGAGLNVGDRTEAFDGTDRGRSGHQHGSACRKSARLEFGRRLRRQQGSPAGGGAGCRERAAGDRRLCPDWRGIPGRPGRRRTQSQRGGRPRRAPASDRRHSRVARLDRHVLHQQGPRSGDGAQRRRPRACCRRGRHQWLGAQPWPGRRRVQRHRGCRPGGAPGPDRRRFGRTRLDGHLLRQQGATGGPAGGRQAQGRSDQRLRRGHSGGRERDHRVPRVDPARQRDQHDPCRGYAGQPRIGRRLPTQPWADLRPEHRRPSGSDGAVHPDLGGPRRGNGHPGNP